MNRWESAAREWNASRREGSLASWHAGDAELEQLVARCVRDER
jgi:hypothetical protein